MMTKEEREKLLRSMGGNDTNCVSLGATPESSTWDESLASLAKDLERAKNPYSKRSK